MNLKHSQKNNMYNKEPVVSFETAKLAKIKGFEGPISTFGGNHYYNYAGELDGDVVEQLKMFFRLRREGHSKEDAWKLNTYQNVAAPTLFELQRWLRDEHQIYIEIRTDCTCEPKFYFEINVFKGNPRNLAEREWGWYFHKNICEFYLTYTYEETLDSALMEALTLVNNDNIIFE